MPSYRQQNVCIELLVSELQSTLPEKIELRMGKQFKHNADTIRQNLLGGVTLTETALTQHPDKEELNHILISAKQDRPCIVTTASLNDRTTTEMALALKIAAPIRSSMLSNKKPKGLKIEIFLNGTLLEVISRRCKRPGAVGTSEQDIDVVSGMRFHRQTEKPLTYRSHNTKNVCSKEFTAEERWLRTGQALVDYAADVEKTIDGVLPPSCEYILALSRMPILEEIRRQGDHFSIIDVIITTGKRSQEDTNAVYLKQPTRLKTPKCDTTEKTPASLLEPVDHATLTSTGVEVYTNNDLEANTEEEVARYVTISGMRIDFQHPVPTQSHPVQSIYQRGQSFSRFDNIDIEQAGLGPHANSHYLLEPLEIESEEGAIPRLPVIVERDMTSSYFSDLDDSLHIYIDPELLPYRRESEAQQEESGILVADGELDDRRTLFEPSPARIPAISIDSVIEGAQQLYTPETKRSTSNVNASPTKYSTALQSLDGSQLQTGQETIATNTPVSSDIFDISPVRFLTAQNTPVVDDSRFSEMSPVSYMAAVMQGSRLSSTSKRLWSQANTPGDNEIYGLDISPDTDERESPSRLIASAPSGASYSIKSVKKTRGADIDRDTMTHTTTKCGRRKVRTHDDKPDLTGSPSKPGSKRTAKQWDPDEDTIEEALAKFTVPELCKDSAVSFAGEGIMRQVNKMRSGEFVKDEFIVGMRIIVF